MRAVQLVEWQAPPELREVDLPDPGPGEVLVRVTAAGLCHSDLHLMQWPEGTLPYTLPFTLGHENAGVVAGLGPGTNGFAEGDPVLVYGCWGCGNCRHCIRGAMNLCEKVEQRGGIGGGLGFDGGLAEYMLVPSAQYLLLIGDLDPVQAAPLTDAALSPYRAIKARLPPLAPPAPTGGRCRAVALPGDQGAARDARARHLSGRNRRRRPWPRSHPPVEGAHSIPRRGH